MSTRFAQIGELISEVKTWSPAAKSGDGTFRYIDLGSVDNETKEVRTTQNVPFKDAPSRARQLVKSGDILVSTVRPNLNGVAKLDDEVDGSTASTGFCVLRPNNDLVDGEYLFQWVKSPMFISDMVRKATGASYPAVTDRVVEQSLIPLPTLSEQRRIGAILSQADDLRRKRQEALRRLSQISLIVFDTMFGNPISNERNWPTRQLREITTKIGSGATPTGGEASYKPAGIALIRSMNVHDGIFIDRGLAYIDDGQAKRLDNVEVAPGDVLLNITGASIARVCRVPVRLLPARVNQHVSIIRPNQDLNSSFLEAAFLHPAIKAKLLMIGEAGATRQAITKAELEQFDIVLPPLNLQLAFAKRVINIELLKSYQGHHLDKLGELFASLQHRAFRGEL